MPIYRVASSQIEVEIQLIEKQERIINVIADGPGAFIVITEPAKRTKPGDTERRSA